MWNTWLTSFISGCVDDPVVISHLGPNTNHWSKEVSKTMVASWNLNLSLGKGWKVMNSNF